MLQAVVIALAAEQKLAYDLSAAGTALGSREVTIDFVSRDTGERRVIDGMTRIDGAGVALLARTSGLSTPSSSSFSSVTEQNGKRLVVSGRELPEGGWMITTVSGGKQTERTEVGVTLSTLDLLDPVRVEALGGSGSFGLVIAETGDVVTGSLGAGETSTVTVSGKKVGATRYVLNADGAVARFFVSDDGVLLRSEVGWLGIELVASLRALPDARAVGSVETIEALGSGVTASDL